jgi:RNA polymerase sigma-70 factor (ECF subfamily)
MPPIEPDSAERRRLLERAQAGDAEAREQLVARHRPFLHQVVALRFDPRLRTRVDPSDVVQEAQLDAFRRLPDYLRRRPMPFRLWLRCFVENLARCGLGFADSAPAKPRQGFPKAPFPPIKMIWEIAGISPAVTSNPF